MKAEKIKAEIEPVYVELFGPTGYEGLDVRVALDHADEPALFVTAKILGVVDATLEARIRQLRERVFDMLRQNEEGRFPYIRISYDDPSVEDIDDGTARRKRRVS